MSKDRFAVTCNGRPAFYAAMYEDIRKCAIAYGWAVALHGSLASDMDIMAMPWTECAVSFEKFVEKIVALFSKNSMAELYTITYNEKPCGRIVATIPIWEDFYLDISTMKIGIMDNFDFFDDFIPEAMKEQIKEDLITKSIAEFHDCLKSGMFKSMRAGAALLNSGRARETQLFLCNAKTRDELFRSFPFMVNVSSAEFIVYNFIKDGEVFEVTDEEAKQSMLQAYYDSKLGFESKGVIKGCKSAIEITGEGAKNGNG